MTTKTKEAEDLEASPATGRKIPLRMEDGKLHPYYPLLTMTWRYTGVTELMRAKCQSEVAPIGRNPCKTHAKQAPRASYLGLVRL